MNLLKLFTIVLFAGSVGACNTMEGAGEDIEAGGEAVSEGARDVKDEIND
ncbi:MAG TPA: entericidin A/B family lipoprotein [Pseudomonadales bacterium]